MDRLRYLIEDVWLDHRRWIIIGLIGAIFGIVLSFAVNRNQPNESQTESQGEVSTLPVITEPLRPEENPNINSQGQVETRNATNIARPITLADGLYTVGVGYFDFDNQALIDMRVPIISMSSQEREEQLGINTAAPYVLVRKGQMIEMEEYDLAFIERVWGEQAE